MPKKEKNDITAILKRIKNYCILQDKCQWDVIHKMKEWGVIRMNQNNILELLIKEKYIDEERYSRSFCRGKFRIKKWGKRKITNELRKKNISNLDISKGLKEINDFEYNAELNRLLKQKHNSIKEKNTFLKNNKTATYLINKGFESSLVWNKIKKLKI